MTSRVSTRPDPAAVRQRWVVLVFLSLLPLLIAVDVTVVNIALPSIGRDFGASTNTLAWVVTGYTIVGGGLLLLGGRVSDLLGRRRMLKRNVDQLGGAIGLSVLIGLSAGSSTGDRLEIAGYQFAFLAALAGLLVAIGAVIAFARRQSS